MYLRDERLRLYQASLEVTVTINRLSIYKLSEWLSLFAISIAVIDVQDTAYVIRDWVLYSVRNPVGIIHSRLNSNRYHCDGSFVEPVLERTVLQH